MASWNEAFREGLVSGSIASLLSAAYLALAGGRRSVPAAPMNAVSHWIFGSPSLREEDPSVTYTATGYLIHHLASIFWGVLHAKAWGADARAKKPLPAIAGAAAAAGVASFVDYQMTPRRFTPGFEHRLGRPEMLQVYTCFAVGLAIGSLLMKKKK